jgi:hypothetical protein
VVGKTVVNFYPRHLIVNLICGSPCFFGTSPIAALTASSSIDERPAICDHATFNPLGDEITGTGGSYTFDNLATGNYTANITDANFAYADTRDCDFTDTIGEGTGYFAEEDDRLKKYFDELFEQI